MNSYLKKSLTLIELLIAIGLLLVIILAISNIDLFARFHTISADRRVKLQNDVSYILEHMTKQISRAIGNEWTDGGEYLVIDERKMGSDQAIRVHIDANNDGRRDSGDYWIAYRLTTGNQLQYCPQCTASSCTTCTPNDWATVAGNTLSTKIAGFSINTLRAPDSTAIECPPNCCPNCLIDNSVEIILIGRWTPSQTSSADNPEVTMRTKIKMPSITSH